MSLISAIGTPLRPDESLHRDALAAHIEDQWSNGMTGILVGGTMGAMQLLTDTTYRALIDHAVESSAGRGEVMIGVGDAGFARTRERIRLAHEKKIDGVVVLPPYLIKFSQEQLISYFTTLADISAVPLFLYDLPGLTGTKLELKTVLELAEHPNIRGIKCSCELSFTRQLIDAAPSGFRVIVAQADLIDMLLRHGVKEHLDGVFALAPHWVREIGDAAAVEDWDRAAAAQRRLSELLSILKQFGVFPTFSAIMNARGIQANFAPAPLPPLSERLRETALSTPIVQELVQRSTHAALTDGQHRRAISAQRAAVR
jgi:4-hydroxy-tetrahydrodipicolinate synthase